MKEENKKACSGTGVGTSLSFGGVEKEKAFYAFSLSRLFGLKLFENASAAAHHFGGFVNIAAPQCDNKVAGLCVLHDVIGDFFKG